MLLKQTIKVSEVLKLQQRGKQVSRWLHDRIVNGGTPVRHVADILHGTWLGHPLHPVLTDITIGAWSIGSLFSLAGPATMLRRAGDLLYSLGTLSAVPTALTGLTDYSGIKQDALEHGALHATANSGAFILHLLAWRARSQKKHTVSLLLALLGTGLATFGAWLGGHLVYRMRVGVNFSPKSTAQDKWVSVMADSELPDRYPVRVEVEDTPVLIYRRSGAVYAINAVCAHAGGPLEEGTFDGTCVTCPWHHSVYDLHDGSIVHGPTVYPQPAYDTRLRDGLIEIRAAHP